MRTVGSHLALLVSGGTTLRKRLVPFVRYVVLLVAVVLLYGWLFHVFMAWEGQEHSWFTGIYRALTVMSTLGFGDITFETDLGRVPADRELAKGSTLVALGSAEQRRRFGERCG